MSLASNLQLPQKAQFGVIWAAFASPIALVVVSSNFVNAGNLAFNMLFSRWMGPALFGDLAVVLTVKLALLGILGAVQMAVTRLVAIQGASLDHSLARLNRYGFVILWFAMPMILLLIASGKVGESLGMAHPELLLIVLISLPFAAALSVLRGVVQGRVDMWSILLSANIEMFVRLFGAIAFWQAGFGITGVVCAIGLSIVAGWAALVRQLPAVSGTTAPPLPLSLMVASATLPFAVLQLSQVLLLDGEIIAAKILFDDLAAGQIAALGLCQRTEFYACFGLVAVLLPKVSKAIVDGASPLKEALPALLVYFAVTLAVIGVSVLAGETLITAMAGMDYLPAADLLPFATGAAAAFTLSYLLATFLAGLGDNRGIWIIAASVPLQIASYVITSTALNGITPIDLMIAKFGGQAALLCALIGVVVLRVRQGGHLPTPNKFQISLF